MNSTALLLSAGGKDFKKHINEIRAARNLPPTFSPSGSRPTSPSWVDAQAGSSSGGVSASKLLTPRQLGGKDVENGECINSPRGVTPRGIPIAATATAAAETKGTGEFGV